MNHVLKNKRALVTGGSRGIGAAIVKRLARDGANVAFTYVSKPDEAQRTAAAAQALGVKSIAIQADSASADAVTAAVETTASEFGGIDILVSSAGIASHGADRGFPFGGFRSYLGDQCAGRVCGDPGCRQAHARGRAGDYDRQL